MKKIVGTFLTAVLLSLLVSQVAEVHAKSRNNGNKPITGPITSPDCKPGWGFGDKNHCHSGPPGHSR
jgi:hypothetical protein